jgi:hypothetical protein
MPQYASRPVAPPNPEPKWPEGYVAVLRQAGALFSDALPARRAPGNDRVDQAATSQPNHCP